MVISIAAEKAAGDKTTHVGVVTMDHGPDGNEAPSSRSHPTGQVPACVRHFRGLYNYRGSLEGRG